MLPTGSCIWSLPWRFTPFFCYSPWNQVQKWAVHPLAFQKANSIQTVFHLLLWQVQRYCSGGGRSLRKKGGERGWRDVEEVVFERGTDKDFCQACRGRLVRKLAHNKLWRKTSQDLVVGFLEMKRIRSFLLQSEGVKSFPIVLQEKEVRVWRGRKIPFCPLPGKRVESKVKQGLAQKLNSCHVNYLM